MSYRIFLVASFMCITFKQVNAQQLRWYQVLTFQGNDTRNQPIGEPAIDRQKNIYFWFKFVDSADLGGIQLKADSGYTNYVLVKYDSHGIYQNHLSLKTDHPSHQYYTPQIYFDSAGHLYIAAYNSVFRIADKNRILLDSITRVIYTCLKFDKGFNLSWISKDASFNRRIIGESTTQLYLHNNALFYTVDKSTGIQTDFHYRKGFHPREVLRNHSDYFGIGDFTDGYFLGPRYDTLYFDSVASGKYIVRDSSGSDIIISKYDQACTGLWFRKISIPGDQIKKIWVNDVARINRQGNLMLTGIWQDTLATASYFFRGSHFDYQTFYMCVDTSGTLVWLNANTSSANMAKVEDIKESEYDSVTDTWNMIGFSNSLDFNGMINITSPNAPYYRLRLDATNGQPLGISNFMSQYDVYNITGVKLKGTTTAVGLRGGLFFEGQQFDKNQCIFTMYDDSVGGNIGVKITEAGQRCFVYPNPSSENIIHLHGSCLNNTPVYLFSPQGSEVLRCFGSEINTSTLSKGLYFGRYTRQDGIEGVFKFVKQ